MRRYLLSAVLSLSVLLSTLVAAQAASYTFTTIRCPRSHTGTVALGSTKRARWWDRSVMPRGASMVF